LTPPVQVLIPLSGAAQDVEPCLRSLATHLPPGCTINVVESFRNLWVAGNDLLLLDPHTEVTAGFLEEMQAVLHLHERHAVVTPRTDHAPFFGIGSQDIWTKIRDILPRYQIAPAAGHFCMLIKGEVLQRFGLFGTGTRWTISFAASIAAVTRR